MTPGDNTSTKPTKGWVAADASFGARLALVRQKMGWGNIAKAAKECGLPTDSWRNWEVDGVEPRRIVTIAMTIAGRTGCDYLWLVHGPGRGEYPPTNGWAEPRIIVPSTGDNPNGRVAALSGGTDPTRPVRQTRPIRAMHSRSHIPVTVTV